MKSVGVSPALVDKKPTSLDVRILVLFGNDTGIATNRSWLLVSANEFYKLHVIASLSGLLVPVGSECIVIKRLII